MRSLTPLPFFLLSSLLGITLLPFFLLPPKENRTSTRDDDRGPFSPSFSPPPSQLSFVFPSSFSENVIQQPAQTPFRFFPFSFSPGNGGWAEIDGGRMGSSRAPPPPPPSSLPLREEEEATHVASSFPRRLSPGRKGGGRRTEGAASSCSSIQCVSSAVPSSSLPLHPLLPYLPLALLLPLDRTTAQSLSLPPSHITRMSQTYCGLRPEEDRKREEEEEATSGAEGTPPPPSGGGKGRELHLPSSAGGIVVACTTS